MKLNNEPELKSLKEKISKLEFQKESEANYQISEESKQLVYQDVS